MKIGIMGLAGTPVRSVATMLAERLSIPVIDSWKDADSKDGIVCENYICDAFCDVNFGLYTSLIVDTVSANTLHEERIKDQVFNKSILLKKDVFMDITMIDPEDVVDEIMQILCSGRYGHYINPRLVFPSKPDTISVAEFWKDDYREDRASNVIMCGDCYRLTEGDNQAYSCMRTGKLMFVNIVEGAFDIPLVKELKACGEVIKMDFDWAIKFYEMLLYSVKFGFASVEAGYANAFQNAAKPWERVHALGIQVI